MTIHPKQDGAIDTRRESNQMIPACFKADTRYRVQTTLTRLRTYSFDIVRRKYEIGYPARKIIADKKSLAADYDSGDWAEHTIVIETSY